MFMMFIKSSMFLIKLTLNLTAKMLISNLFIGSSPLWAAPTIHTVVSPLLQLIRKYCGHSILITKPQNYTFMMGFWSSFFESAGLPTYCKHACHNRGVAGWTRSWWKSNYCLFTEKHLILFLCWMDRRINKGHRIFVAHWRFWEQTSVSCFPR